MDKRLNTFKKKDSGINQRSLRAHRRSIEVKQSRDTTFTQRRKDLHLPLSPLNELHQPPQLSASKPPANAVKNKATVSASDSRREKLAKWREEKELKKKLEAEDKAKKKPFKVCHVERAALSWNTKGEMKKSTAASNRPLKTTQVKAAKEIKKNTITCRPTEVKRVTRSQTCATKPAAVKSTAVRSKTTATRGKGVSKTLTKPAKTASAAEANISFAPADFKFKPPVGLQSFRFKPLSPTSAANFLCGQDVSGFTPPSTRRCSTPKCNMFKGNESRKSVQGLTLIESESSEGSDADTMKIRGTLSSSPVVCLEKCHIVKPVKDTKKCTSDKDLKTSRKSVGNVNYTTSKSNDVKSRNKTQTSANQSRDKTQTSANQSRDKTQTPTNQSRDKTQTSANQSRDKTQTPTNQSRDKTQTSANQSRDKAETSANQSRDKAQISANQSRDKTPTPVNTYSYSAKKIQNQPPNLSGKAILESTVNSGNNFKKPSEGGEENTENMEPDTQCTPSHTASTRKHCRTQSLNFSKFKTPKLHRTSLILRTLSPEEGIEVLRQSPMVELTRRTPKSVLTSPANQIAESSLPSFDDIEEELKSAEEEIRLNKSLNASVCEASEKVAVHGVAYFRRLVVSQTSKLNELCDKWETSNKDCHDLTETVRGDIRTAIGKAQLLIAQRFKQFSGLIDDCEFKRGEKETTCEDLQGFWDMVYYQVEDVNKMFSDLDHRQADNWKEPEKVIKKKSIKKKAITKKAGGKSKFAEFRAKMKQQQEKPVDTNPCETKTFEAGFFQVQSPVKESASPVRQGASKSRGNTPVAASPMLKMAVVNSFRKSLSETTHPNLKRKSLSVIKSPAKGKKLALELPEDGKTMDTPLRRSLRRSIRKSSGHEATSAHRTCRNVRFAVQETSASECSDDVRQPVTPYMKHSIVPKRRRLSGGEQMDTGTPTAKMSKLSVNVTPTSKSSRAHRRISGFTPPQSSSHKSVSPSAGDLIVFSPLPNASGFTPRRSRRLSRLHPQ